VRQRKGARANACGGQRSYCDSSFQQGKGAVKMREEIAETRRKMKKTTQLWLILGRKVIRGRREGGQWKKGNEMMRVGSAYMEALIGGNKTALAN